MKVVSYARVSTLAQESEGQSLANQERVFARWIDRSGALRVRAYREAASAGTVEGRAEFTRMIRELGDTRPDAIIVDTLDRFTRSLREGLELLEQLRGHHVGLLPIDWRRERPIDVDDDRDWSDVVEEFTGAERERRKIRRRVLRAYEGRRERGATVTNRPSFGLLKQGDRIVPDPSKAWLLEEVERRVLAREAYRDIAAWARSIDPTAWHTRMGVRWCIVSPAYVAAGARTPERQAELDVVTNDHGVRYGRKKRIHQLEFTGLFVCGICVDLGYAPERSIMMGGVQKGRERAICEHRANLDHRGHSFYCDERFVGERWREYVAGVASNVEAIERWARGDEPAGDRRLLERRLAQIDQRVAALAERRDRALDLLADPNPAVARQVRQALMALDGDEAGLAASREAVLGELAAMARPPRDTQLLRDALASFLAIYDGQERRQRNALSRALVDVVGGRPELRRIGGGGRGQRYEVVMTWPAVDAFTGDASSETSSRSQTRARQSAR